MVKAVAQRHPAHHQTKVHILPEPGLTAALQIRNVELGQEYDLVILKSVKTKVYSQNQVAPLIRVCTSFLVRCTRGFAYAHRELFDVVESMSTSLKFCSQDNFTMGASNSSTA